MNCVWNLLEYKALCEVPVNLCGKSDFRCTQYTWTESAAMRLCITKQMYMQHMCSGNGSISELGVLPACTAWLLVGLTAIHAWSCCGAGMLLWLGVLGELVVSAIISGLQPACGICWSHLSHKLASRAMRAMERQHPAQLPLLWICCMPTKLCFACTAGFTLWKYC